MPKIRFGWLGLLGVLFVTACASYPKNAPLSTLDQTTGYRFDTLDAHGNTERLFVVVTMSGGGTRAAALAYGAMEKLHSTAIHWDGKAKTLLDEVDVISSVSGGSFAAAYYGLFRDKFFEPDGFRKDMLYRNVQGELELALFNPLNVSWITSPTYGRSELADTLYDRTIFAGKTFDDLKAQGRPFLMINATDMSAGSGFTFDQDQFDYLCSDLGPLHVSRAVEASSNFPIAFAPSTFNNYASRCAMEKPAWIEQAEKDGDYSLNPRRNARARLQWSYRDADKRPYIHLLDGGVADNIGLRGPLTSMTSGDVSWSIQNKIANGEIDKLVVIVVDAKTRAETKYDQSAVPPGLFSVIDNIATTPLDNYSFDTIELLKDKFHQEQEDRQMLWKNPMTAFQNCAPPPDNATASSIKPVDFYAIYVGFDQIADGKTYFGKDRDWYLGLPTAFALPDETVTDLIGLGGALLDESPQFQALAKCLK